MSETEWALTTGAEAVAFAEWYLTRWDNTSDEVLLRAAHVYSTLAVAYQMARLVAVTEEANRWPRTL